MDHHISHPQNTVDEDMVFEFLETSRRLLSLIENENRILEESGYLSIESYLLHRDSLLKKYEQTALNLMDKLNDATNSSALGQLMIEEIVSIKQALNDNTHKKFKSLEHTLSVTRSTARNKQGDSSWH
ncbi:MAG: hypothetical protein RBR86_04560 [Pseudobdellovibrionaceae bacterium]|jgi:hypothetical protein|nr:hypothetical protein [Pseudobdellovibrionaceae bacterium]